MKISIYLLFILLLVGSCKKNHPDRVSVKSEPIENFSDITYVGAPEHNYFYEITSLPIGFSLGDFHDSNSILYMTESANIATSEDENLSLFLTDEELESALNTYVDSSFTEPSTRVNQYYPYERLITKNYVLLIINKRKNQSNGRNYNFYLRTYTFDGKLIDNISLAQWNDDEKVYFSGWIFPDMTIERVHRDEKKEHFQITEKGKIITLNRN